MTTLPAVVTIVDLTTATTLSTTALFEVAQTSDAGQMGSFKVSLQQIASAVATGGGGITSVSGSTGIQVATTATSAVIALGTATPLSVLGVAGTATAIPLPIAGVGDQVLRLNSAGTSVAFGAINLATSAAVTGTLAVAFGGIGLTTLATGDLLYANTATTLARLAATTAGLVLTANGAGAAPSYTAAAGGIASIIASTGISASGSTTVTIALATTTPLSVLGVAGTATTNPLPIVGVGEQVLRLNAAGTSVAFGAVNLSTTAAVTGTLAVLLGGIGMSALATGDILYATNAATLARQAISTATQVLQVASGATTLRYGAVNLTTAVTGTLTVPFGGLGFSALATGDILYATNDTTIARQAISTATQVLMVASGATTLRYGAVNLTTAVTGVLTVPFGGIGTAALTAFAVVVAGTNATAAFQALATTGASGTILMSQGSAALPIFAAVGAGTGDVIGPSSATDLALAAFSSTDGKHIQNTAVTLTTSSAAGILAVGGVNLTPNIPQTSHSAAYTAVLADANTQILHPLADGTNRTFTIPANGSVPYPLGTCLTFVNETATLTIAINSDTLMVAGTGSTGSRTLAANGMVTAIKITTTKWMISGAGLA